jgi:hypothetical protein
VKKWSQGRNFFNGMAQQREVFVQRSQNTRLLMRK